MGQKCTTHVANAYHCDVFVKCDAEKVYVTNNEVNASVNASGKGYSGGVSGAKKQAYDWHKIQAEFTRVTPRTALAFDVDARDRGHVYITVIGADGHSFANNLPRYEDKSVIATRAGGIESAQYGKLWLDESGRSH